tara:strand:- start:351 stop:542 length:192 start_codon:yes stop_codon:yes gene_type:complete
LYLFGFSTNRDAASSLVFGRDLDTWLNYTLIFFGLTALAFVSVWIIGLLQDIRAGKSIPKPWE